MIEEIFAASLLKDDSDLLLQSQKRPYPTPRQVVFIDSRVNDYWTLLDRLSPSAQVFIINGASDGLSQIASALDHQADIESIHIISHGSSGSLYLGSTRVDAGVLETHQMPLAAIGNALVPNGDILLYGCDVALGTEGLQFISTLALKSGADVAASTNLTGGFVSGGDLLLEAATGAIETPPIVPASYKFSLGTATASSNVEFLAFSWKNHILLDGVSVTSANQASTTDIKGVATLSAISGTTLSFTGTRAIPTGETADTSSAVNLQDAIAILKLIVGLPVNGTTNGSATPLSPYQALAADFDGDGKVTLTDAIGVLKHVVGLSAPSPTWHFVNELDPSLSSITDLAPGVAKTTLTADLSGTGTSHVGMVA